MSYLQSDYSKNTYQQHQQKQSQQLFPQYSYNKKNGISPIKQSSSSAGDGQVAMTTSSTNLQVNDVNKLQKQQNYQQSASSLHSITGIPSIAESKSISFIPPNQPATNQLTQQWMSLQPQMENNNSTNYTAQSPKYVQSNLTQKDALTKPISRFSITAFNGEGVSTTTQDFPVTISSSRIDLSYLPKDVSSSVQLHSQADSTPSNRQVHLTSGQPNSFFNQHDSSTNYSSQIEQSISQKHLGVAYTTPINSKVPTYTPTQIGTPFKQNEILQSQVLSPQIKNGFVQAGSNKGHIDPLVQSVTLSRNRSKSPSFELKSSQNFGISKKYPQTFQQPSQSTSQSKLTTSQNIQASYFTSPVQPYGSSGLRIRDLQATSPDANRTSNQLNHSGSPSPKQKQAGSSSLTNNFYKVASQIRRNTVKDSQSPGGINSEKRDLASCSLTGSTFLGHAQQQQKSIPTVPGQLPFAGLTLSQNVGRATAMSTAHLKKPQPSRSPAGNIKRQKSSGSVEGRNITETVDPRKRFTVVDKFNEKYTKKMIIDLCNYMNISQEGQTQHPKDEQPQSTGDSRNNFHSSKDTKNANMNMLDMLSKQRVSQRSVSNSKRMDSKLQGIKEANPESSLDQAKQDKLTATASTKRLSFRFSEKPWENNSYGSRYGSFSAMRSSSNSGAHQPAQNSAKNWNINGSQNFSSTSHPSEITASVVQIGTKSTAAGDLDASASKSIINKGTFILKGFNDSQEIHSSRNFQMEKKSSGISNIIGGSIKASSSKGNVLTKNITSADLAQSSPLNPNSKYKFSTGHLNKPTTTSNSFAKSTQSQQQKQELLTSLSSRGQPKQEIPAKGTTNAKNGISQPPSPQPNSSSFPNSKNSTKSEIKKSTLSDNGTRNSQQRDQNSNNTNSQSFEDPENICKDDDENDQDDVDCQDEDNDFDDEGDGDDPFHVDDNKSQLSSEHSSNGGISPFQTAHGYATTPSQNMPYQHTFSSSNARGTPYNFDAQLEHHPDVQINLEELKKERMKLIRKIMSTFKIKNKALSTSQEYYKVLHVVGKGAFAKVCLAIQLLTGKLVAIKLIDKQILRSDSAKKRVLQEVHILKKLNGHKHVLKLLEVFENRKLIFIVTEYFHGNDLMKMMKERNGAPYSEDQVRNMLAQILSGLRYIHGNMVLHRDIKLDNLLVDSNMNLKIIDFGISRVIQKDQRMTEQCGTPAFLAPEIIANKGYEGFASDFWSLGVLIYILLYGRVPFKGNSLNELHKNILNGVLPKDEMREVNVSNEAQDLIFKILRIKVKERIGLEAIVQSPWMRGFPIPDGNDIDQSHQPHSLGHFSGENSSNDPILTAASSIKSSIAMPNEQFDERIIGHIESFGYSREYILRCLVKQNLSHVNAIYKLLKKH